MAGTDYGGAMQQWLFVSSSGQQFTAHEPDVPALVQSGQIGAQTLMWREGMPQWMPAASVFPVLFSGSTADTQPMVAGAATATAGAETPAVAANRAAGQSPAATGQVSEAVVRRLAAPLFQRTGWIKLLGILSIVGGVFALPALLLGLLPLFAGIALMKLAGSLKRAQATGDVVALEEAQRNASKYFFLTGILMAIQLAAMVIAIVILLMTSGAAIFSGLESMKRGGMDDPNSPPTIDDIRFPDSSPPDEGN